MGKITKFLEAWFESGGKVGKIEGLLKASKDNLEKHVLEDLERAQENLKEGRIAEAELNVRRAKRYAEYALESIDRAFKVLDELHSLIKEELEIL